MAKYSEKGSIILKLLVLILLIGLLAVILLPGKIWDEEAREQRIEQDNLVSIYEALRFYKRGTGSYTTNPNEIMRVVHNDSSIMILQKVVNYTNQLTNIVDSFLRLNFIRGLVELDQNMSQIIEDLENNRRYLNIDENIRNEADNLQTQLKELKSISEFTNYISATNHLDSLRQLRRDLTDYSLQVAAMKSSAKVDTIQSLLDKIDYARLENSWKPISERLNRLTATIRRTDEITKSTSVGDRVRDFTDNVDKAFRRIKSSNVAADIDEAGQLKEKLQNTYSTFLKDFIVTSKLSLYRLPEADSLMIHLTHENFYSPVNGEMYKIIIDEDSSAVKVESPVLIDELHEMVQPVLADLDALPIASAFDDYFSMLDSVKNTAFQARQALRRNTDVFIKFKEIEEIINRYEDISVTTAYRDLVQFVDVVPGSESYSEIKDQLGSVLNGVRLLNQAYSMQNFGMLDTLQRDLLVTMDQYNVLLDGIRRLPKEARKYETEMDEIKRLEAKLKGLDVAEPLSKLEEKIGKALIFAAEGKEVRMYGVFNKRINNYGNIYRDDKSWERQD